MISFLRIISLILFIGLVLAIGVALFIGSGTPGGLPAGNETFLAAVLVLALFVAPALAAYGWIIFREREAEALVREAKASLSSAEKGEIETWRYRGLLGEIARLLEESRQLILVQRRGLAERDLFRARILEGIGEGVLAIDRRKAIVVANARALEMLGVGELPAGTPLYAVVREAAITAAFERALAGERASELVTLRPGAAERRIDVQILPFEGETDIAAVALLVDVTRLTNLEKARRQFLADFSHEVRTPLAGLRSAAETLERGELPPADEAHLRRIVGRQLDRLERLVADLSELNRIESGALILAKRPTDLGELLHDVADDFRTAAEARGVLLEVAGEGAAEVDPQRMQQIVANLVDNAIKFTPSGSTVRLGVRRRDDAIEIAVADEGEGIPDHERERVFNRFYRVDKSRSQSVPGTGLGLAIAKHLTVLHGGRIEVDSSSLRGATFRVLLPLR
jgi:two-component system, OmpR family, phosphate regulon sensor histidine kinase PhoR